MTALQPKIVDIPLPNGAGTKAFIIHKFDCMSGREIVTKYPVSNIPKLAEYKSSEETMLKLMAFVGVQAGERVQMLENADLVKNHVPDWETLMRLEWAVLEYNCSFFGSGLSSDFFENLKAQALQKISPILTGFAAQLLEAVKQPSTN